MQNLKIQRIKELSYVGAHCFGARELGLFVLDFTLLWEDFFIVPGLMVVFVVANFLLTPPPLFRPFGCDFFV